MERYPGEKWKRSSPGNSDGQKAKDQVECWLCDWFCDDEQVITYFAASDSSSTVKTLD